MKHSEIREIFYSFFEKKGHKKVLSAPLIPAKDPTLMFTNAGMNQFKDLFLQKEERDYKRAVTIQKCMRVSGKHNDFDEVGKTEFHHTFFEMLGNFSFGDYFKEDAIAYAWELLTEHYKFKPEDLWITVYKNDDEAFEIWEKKIGIPAERIVRLGDKDNFWQMGETGPCGPCSEIHFDRGESFGPADVEGNAKRFVEVWNLVFMQYMKDKEGILHDLPAPSIDTGMGLERVTTLLQGKNSNYANDLFRPIIEFTAELAGVDPDDENYQIPLKVVADHSRSLAFLISDGILPANDGRGYVLRRVLRRAAKHGRSIGFDSDFLYKVTDFVVDHMKDHYPELEYNRKFIKEVVLSEEQRFERTLLNGLKRFEAILETKKGDTQVEVTGEELFRLSDTYGFPVDFAVDLAAERGDLILDLEGYGKTLEARREESRKSLDEKRKSAVSLENIDSFTTDFEGYDSLEGEAEVLAIYSDNKLTDRLIAGAEGMVVFNKTPFYAESGGQAGDIGKMKAVDCLAEVNGCIKGGTGAFLHKVRIVKGELKKGDSASLFVDSENRQNTAVHHTATHLLHSALREVLGLHVKQAGSYVDAQRFRFDFTHYKGLSTDELAAVEKFVNDSIRKNIGVATDYMDYEEALSRGAIAIFEEKYSDVVRLVEMGNVSKELCGGTHLGATGEIGVFRIVSESSIASGVRRIEAVAGKPGFEFISEQLSRLSDISAHFNQKTETVMDHLVKMEKSLKDKEKEIRNLSRKSNTEVKPDTVAEKSVEINGVAVAVDFVEGIDRKRLSTLADQVRDANKGIAVLITNAGEKSAIVASVNSDVIADGKGDAGKIVRVVASLLNGKGGGRKEFAQAGGEEVKDSASLIKNIVAVLEKEI